MQSNFCPLSRLAAQHHNRSQLWRRVLSNRRILSSVLKGLLLMGLVVGATRAIVQLSSWLSLHNLHLAALLTDTWLEPSAVNVLGLCVVLNIAWVMNLLVINKLWQRFLVNILSWVAVVSFVTVMLPLSHQLGQLMVSRISSFGLAEATLWGMIVMTASLVWLSVVVLMALLITQTFGFTHTTHRIRHYLAALVGLQLQVPALTRTSNQLEGV